MKKTILMFVPVFMAIAAVPAGYDHWTAEQFRTREEVLHKTLKNGLTSETLGHWGNHLLLKTRREASSGQAESHGKQADLIVVRRQEASAQGGRHCACARQNTAPGSARGGADT